MFDKLSKDRDTAQNDHSKVKQEKQQVNDDYNKVVKELADLKLERQNKEALFE